MSEVIPQERIGDNPQKEKKAKPEDASFATVDAQFNGFRARRAQKLADGAIYDDARGGVPYPEKRSIKEFGQNRTPDYHVESSFDREEGQYVVRAVSLVDKLARGENGQHLADLIVKHFMAGEKKSFLQSIDYGIKELLKEFADKYPSLMPAMDSMYQIGGGEGTRVAISMCRQMIEENYKAFEGLPSKPNPTLKLEEMASQHPNEATEDEPYSYEIMCSGMAFAKEILDQAAVAALDVVEVAVRNKLNIQEIIATDKRFVSSQEEMSGTVHALYEQAKAAA